MQRPAKPWTPVQFRPPPPHDGVYKFSRDGGTGRRKGLKIPREHNSRAGSIPARGTIFIWSIFEMIKFSLNKHIRRKYQPKYADFNKLLRKSLVNSYKNVYIDISIVTSKMSKSLNKQYRHRDYPTNVISLEYSDTRKNFAMLTGELILCDDIIVNEANLYKKQIFEHYAHIIIHGLLHLQGFDHIEINQALQMESLETKILNSLGFSAPYLFMEI